MVFPGIRPGKVASAGQLRRCLFSDAQYRCQPSRRPKKNVQFDCLDSLKRSAINIRRSMLDVRCSTFNLLAVDSQAEFHIGGVAG